MSQFIEMFKSEDNYEPLENIVVVKDDCRKPINDGVRGSMKEGELYPYYGATGVVDYINDYITDEELLCIAEDCGNYKAGEDSSYIINGKAWVNNHAHLVKAKQCCEIKYLHQYLKITDLMPYVSGTTRLKLTQKKMKEIPVLLPSIELQNKFVSIAEQADKSGFDGLKSQFIEMFGNPVANNKGWNTLPIKDVAPEEPSLEKQTGKVWILNLDMIESNTCKIVGKVFEDDSNLLSVAPFDEGNVLYSKLRPYLNKVVIPDGKGYATTELVPLRPNQELLNLTFFSHLLRGDDFVTYANSISTGTKMPRMPLNDLRKFPCILPPMEKQKEFEEIARQADKSGSVWQYRIAC